MRNIEIEGCSRVQELLVLNKLSYETVPSGHILIEFHQDVEIGKGDSLWYGGDMVSIYYNGYEFIITADGDVRITLHRKADDEIVAEVIDKSMRGKFKEEMSEYIKNDARLDGIHRGEDDEYYLYISNNNWYELTYIDRENQWHDLGCALNSSVIYDAITEAIVVIPEYVAEFEREETNE